MLGRSLHHDLVSSRVVPSSERRWLLFCIPWCYLVWASTATPSRVKDVTTNSAALQVVRARLIACLDFSALITGLLVWHLADGLFSAGAAAARFQLTWMLPWMAVLVSTSRALVGEGGPHVRCTWLATTLKFVDLVVWCPTRHRYVFGERHPSDWDSKRAGQHVDSDCTWLEPAQTPWVALVLFFYLALGRPVLSIVSLIFFCWRGWFSQSDLHNLDFPFLFSALHYSCASWALVNGRAYLIQRSVRVPTSQCWRHLRVVLWRSPTACGIPWKPGGGKTLPSAFQMYTKQSVGHEPRAARHCYRRARS